MEKMTQMPLWRRSDEKLQIHAECTKDFILPDSYPDIRKILYTAGTLCPGRCFAENGKLSCGGNLICKVLFSDENDEIHTVQFTMEYNGQTPIKDQAGEAAVTSDEVLQNVSARALNPRKLNLKGKIEVIPRIFYEIEAGPSISEDLPEDSLEKRCKVIPFWKLSQVREQSLEASEDLSLPGDAPVQEVIFANLNMGTASCEAVQGSIRFSGEATLELFYRSPDGGLHFTELPIPFHSSIDADVSSDAFCMVSLTPEQLSCVPSEDATGEAHGVELDFSYSVTAWIAVKAESSQVTDCYSVNCPTKLKEGRATVIQSFRKAQKQQRRMMSCPADGMKKCLKTFAKVYADSVEKNEGRMILHCMAEVTVLGTDENGKPMTLTLMEAFPWEIEEGDEVSVCFSASADPMTEAEEIKAALTVNAEIFLWQNGELNFVTDILPDLDQKCVSRSAVTLCYPLPGESIWDIAKRYRVPQSVLLAANTIGEGALPQVLLIPGERKPVFSKMI